MRKFWIYFASAVIGVVKRKYWTPEKAWAYVEQMQGESKVAEAVGEIAPFFPKSSFGLVVEKARAIQSEYNRVEVLSAYLPRFSLANLSPTDWQSYLHLLAHRTRAEVMQDLKKLYPAIVHLGGKEAVRGMVDAMREVCSQWK